MMETLAGKVEWVRMGSQQVVAGNKLCYAIKRDRDFQVVVSSLSGMIVFSDKGAGLLPVCIRASSGTELKIALRSSDVKFNIQGELAASEMEGAYKIHVKLTKLVQVKPIEIHDVTSTIMKNILMFPIGVFGPDIGSVLGKTAHFVQYATTAGSIQQSIGAASDFRDAVKSIKESASGAKEAFGKKGKKSGKIGIIVSYYPMNNSVATGLDTISAQDIAKIFF